MSNDARWTHDPTGRHELRYWDGAAWTDHVSDQGRQSSDPIAPGPTSARQASGLTTPVTVTVKKGGLRWWAWLLIGFVALGIIGAAIPSDDAKNDDGASAAQAADVTTTVSTTTTTQTVAAVPAPTPTPNPTVEIEWSSPEETTKDQVTLRGTVTFNAHVKVGGHRASVSGTRWSKVVKIKHRGDNIFNVSATKKGFDAVEVEATVTRKPSAAERAAYHRAQAERRAGQRALESAENYLSIGAFSKKGLYQQLSSSAGEGFTASQAQYAVDHVGADWKKEAVESARNYLDISPMSRQQLLEQLTSDAGDGFTYAQASYAVGKVY